MSRHRSECCFFSFSWKQYTSINSCTSWDSSVWLLRTRRMQTWIILKNWFTITAGRKIVDIAKNLIIIVLFFHYADLVSENASIKAHNVFIFKLYAVLVAKVLKICSISGLYENLVFWVTTDVFLIYVYTKFKTSKFRGFINK